jgi:hypothetical protein
MVGFALPVAAAASLITAHVLAQPKQAGEDRNASFTAFPEIAIPKKNDEREGFKGNVTDLDRLFARLCEKHPRPIPPNAPALVKVRTAQVNEGARYLIRTSTRFELGTFRDFSEMVRVTSDVYRAAAELEPTAAGKTGYLEDRVAVLKFVEELVIHYVREELSPHSQQIATFYRLQAEADLIQLKESLKGGK